MKNFFTLPIFLLFGTLSYAQNNVGINTTTPDISAVLDVSSTTKGVLVPRMTRDQRNGIGTPATGLMIYQTDNTPGFYFNSGNSTSPSWTPVSGTSLPAQSGNTGKVLKTDGTNLSWETPSTGAPYLLLNGFVASMNSLGDGTFFPNGAGWNATESDGHRVLSSPVTSVKLTAFMAGPVTTPYIFSIRRGTPGGGTFTYTDLSTTTISVSNGDIKTINLTGLSLAAGETLAIKIVGTKTLSAAGQGKTLNYNLTAQ